MQANKDKKTAFTLIELIMTIVVMAIIVIPSSLFLIESMSGVFRSEDITVALNLARMELEKTNNMLYDNIPTGTLTYNKYETYNYDLSRQVDIIEQKKVGKETITVKQIKIDVYPKDKLGSTADLITRVITHRTSNVNYD